MQADVAIANAALSMLFPWGQRRGAKAAGLTTTKGAAAKAETAGATLKARSDTPSDH
jgi:hypothetical protein